MMKIIKIKTCSKCPYLKPIEKICMVMSIKDFKPVYIDDFHSIPSWCPLEDAE